MSGPVPNLERAKRYKTLRETGLSMAQIAAQFNVSKQSVAWRLRGAPKQEAKSWAERQAAGFAELSDRKTDAVNGSAKLLAAINIYRARHEGWAG